MNTLIYLVSQRKSPARLCWAFRFTLSINSELLHLYVVLSRCIEILMKPKSDERGLEETKDSSIMLL
jgi:hypothetical protein